LLYLYFIATCAITTCTLIGNDTAALEDGELTCTSQGMDMDSSVAELGQGLDTHCTENAGVVEDIRQKKAPV